MKNLLRKYREDTLSPQELEELRQHLSTFSREEIEEHMFEDWDSEEKPDVNVEEITLERVKRHIDTRIEKKNTPTFLSKHIFIRATQIAAAVLLVFFMGGTVYYYNAAHKYDGVAMEVTTNEYEPSVTLPDGSSVALNTHSRLTYNPADYNRKERKVRFSGEAFFQITKDAKHPFVIEVEGMNIQVLGTVFNLSAYPDNDKVELTLEEGKVELQSKLTGIKVEVNPNQKATLNRSNGKITIVDCQYAQDASAWQRGEIVLRDIPLVEVLNAVKKIYGVNIEVKGIENVHGLFTGTLPTTNLDEVLKVIERTYNLSINKPTKVIFSTAEKQNKK